MKKIAIMWLTLGLTFLATAISISSSELQNSGINSTDDLPYTHSYTKAFCDSENFCRDFEIFCKNKEIIGIRFTGVAIQLQENWQDPRDEKTKSVNC